MTIAYKNFKRVRIWIRNISITKALGSEPHKNRYFASKTIVNGNHINNTGNNLD